MQFIYLITNDNLSVSWDPVSISWRVATYNLVSDREKVERMLKMLENVVISIEQHCLVKASAPTFLNASF